MLMLRICNDGDLSLMLMLRIYMGSAASASNPKVGVATEPQLLNHRACPTNITSDAVEKAGGSRCTSNLVLGEVMLDVWSGNLML